jgi:hypothetical protein
MVGLPQPTAAQIRLQLLQAVVRPALLGSGALCWLFGLGWNVRHSGWLGDAGKVPVVLPMALMLVLAVVVMMRFGFRKRTADPRVLQMRLALGLFVMLMQFTVLLAGALAVEMLPTFERRHITALLTFAGIGLMLGGYVEVHGRSALRGSSRLVLLAALVPVFSFSAFASNARLQCLADVGVGCHVYAAQLRNERQPGADEHELKACKLGVREACARMGITTMEDPCAICAKGQQCNRLLQPARCRPYPGTEGEPCAPVEGAQAASPSFECAGGLRCIRPKAGAPARCIPYRKKGQACREHRECNPVTKHRCRWDGTRRSCGSLQAEGGPCHTRRDCEEGLGCSEQRCRVPAKAGEPCRGDDACQSELRCNLGHRSAEDEGECEPPGASKTGQPCSAAEHCETGLRCIRRRCHPRGNVGRPCEQDDDCKDGLVCNQALTLGSPSCRQKGGKGSPCARDSDCGNGAGPCTCEGRDADTECAGKIARCGS